MLLSAKATMGLPGNPWSAGNLDDFLFYCCPQCDEKFRSVKTFFSHALDSHEQARTALLGESEPDPKPVSGVADDNPPVEKPIDVAVKLECYPDLSGSDPDDDFSDDPGISGVVSITTVAESFEDKDQTGKLELLCNVCGSGFDTMAEADEHEQACHYQTAEQDNPKENVETTDDMEKEGEEDLIELLETFYAQDSEIPQQENESSAVEFQPAGNNPSKAVKPAKVIKGALDCRKCDYRAKNKGWLVRHTNSVHKKVVKLFCEPCDKRFSSLAAMETHNTMFHSKPENYVCEACGAVFQSGNHLKQHKARCHPTYFMCTLCEKPFRMEKKLAKHLKAEHRVSPGNGAMVCPTCSRQFPSVFALNEHNINEHRADASIACSHCDLAFSSPLVLKLHLLEDHLGHNTESASKVNVLRDVFNITDKKLKAPVVAKKGFECEVCGKVLSRTDSLDHHRRQVHEKSKHGYKCDDCAFTTYTHCLMRKHKVDKHEKTKKIFCTKCPSFFHTKRDLNSHVARVHEKRCRFTCSVCDQGFRDQLLHAHHMMTAHHTVNKDDK